MKQTDSQRTDLWLPREKDGWEFEIKVQTINWYK